MTQIYLLRHAESLPLKDQPQDLWPLSPKGQKQAGDLIAGLRNLGITHIHSSPYPRAVQTVEPFAKAIGVPIQLHEDLRERHAAPGFVDNFLEVMQRAWQDLDFALPGCETGTAAQARIMAWLQQWATDRSAPTILVSSHGNLIGLALKSLVPGFGFSDWRRMKNPDLFRLVLSQGRLHWDQNFVWPG